MQDGRTEINTYGKFKSAEELLAAYNALEREFTKRCQLIKTLKTASENACAQENEREADASAPPPEQCSDNKPEQAQSAAPDETAAVQITQETAPEDAERKAISLAPHEVAAYVAANAQECAQLLAEIPEVTDACIAKYKQKLIGMHCSPAIRGAAVITPVRRPKTLEEAKILADEMLR